MLSKVVGRPVKYVEDRARQPLQLRPPRLGARATTSSSRSTRTAPSRPPARRRRRLRRLHPVRVGHARQRDGPGHRPVPDRSVSSTGRAASSRTSASRAPTGDSAPRCTTSCSSASSTSLPASSVHGPGRAPAAELHPPRAVPATTSPAATSTTAATTRRCSTRRSSWPTSSTGGASRSGCARRVATSASALVTCQERSVYAANEWWFFRPSQGVFVTSVPESITLSVDATGGVTATLYSTRLLGQQPRDDGGPVRGRGARRRARRRQRRLRGDETRASRAAGPGGSRFTVMIAGAIAGRGGQDPEQGDQGRRPHARGRPRRPRVASTAACRCGATPDARKALGEIAVMPRLFKHSLPDDIDSGFEAHRSSTIRTPR